MIDSKFRSYTYELEDLSSDLHDDSIVSSNAAFDGAVMIYRKTFQPPSPSHVSVFVLLIWILPPIAIRRNPRRQQKGLRSRNRRGMAPGSGHQAFFRAKKIFNWVRPDSVTADINPQIFPIFSFLAAVGACFCFPIYEAYMLNLYGECWVLAFCPLHSGLALRSKHRFLQNIEVSVWKGPIQLLHTTLQQNLIEWKRNRPSSQHVNHTYIKGW